MANSEPAALAAKNAAGRAAMVDPAALAAILGVERSWVYEHADELGAYRLGSGPRARLRFDVDQVLERLRTCSVGRRPDHGAEPMVERQRPRRRRPGLGTSVELLPIRGGRP